MEIDSSCYDSSKLVEFPKIITNSIHTLKNNSRYYNSDYSNNIVSTQTSKKKSDNKNLKQKNEHKSKELLKLLLAQKIAKNKINHMNFNKITSAIINYKNNYTTNEDPINKYIDYFIPYENKEDLSSDFIRINNEFFYDIKKINTKKKKKENEKYISFKKENLKKQNYYFSRMNNAEHINKTINYEDNIIMIQKHIRGFILREKINKEISRLIVNYIINNIIMIQRVVRAFLNRKNYYKKEIIKIIQKERKVKANKIVDMFSMYHLRNEYKKILLIRNILTTRIKSANIICRAIKYYLLRKKIKLIKYLQSNNLEIIYPINNKKDIKLKIYYNDNMSKSFDFHFCELRKIYVLYINSDMLENSPNTNKNEYFCHFFVDDQCVIDKRYKIVKNKYGIVYNLIEFKNKESINSINESYFNSINEDKYIDKYEKIKTNSIPFNNENDLFSGYRNFKPNISGEINDYNDNNDNNSIYNSNKNINTINSIYVNKKLRKNKKNKFPISVSNFNININDLKNNNINSYVDSYIKDYNDIHLYKKLGYGSNFINYPQDISENVLGNSSSTISNSKVYIKHEKKKSDKNEILIEDKNEINKFNKKKKKIFPVFY